MCQCLELQGLRAVPEESVGGRASVGDVIEEDLQLVVVVEVCGDNGSNRGWHGKLLGCYVLRNERYINAHTHSFTQDKHMEI